MRHWKSALACTCAITTALLSPIYAEETGDPLGKNADVIRSVDTDNANKPQACTPEFMKALLTQGSGTLTVTCIPSLTSKNIITKNLLFSGNQSSNITFNCNGATLPSLVSIRSSRKKTGEFIPVTHVTIKNCRTTGAIRVGGMGVDDLRPSSFRKGHTERAQNAAPHNITIENNTFDAHGPIPIYISPGVTHANIIDNTFKGFSESVAIYLDAESANHTVTRNTFDTRTSREVIAIDGSAHNTINANTFKQYNLGGIFLYRNCGERGVVRHQTPSYNLIKNNIFNQPSTGTASFGRVGTDIVIASRNGNRNYCDLDNGHHFGSSIDNRDFAQHNTVIENTFARQSQSDKPENHISVNFKPNTVKKNKLTDSVSTPTEPTCPFGGTPQRDENGKVILIYTRGMGRNGIPLCNSDDSNRGQ